MSFTLRNLFSEEDGESEADWGPGEGGEVGSREGLNGVAPAEKGNKQTFLVGELLPFIPPAIAASGAVPSEKAVEIPMNPDGSTDVKLSTLFQYCPELFEAEITPLNDSIVTLPAKLDAEKAESKEKAGSSIFDAPVQPFGAPGFGAPAGETAVADEVAAEDNPFWSPDSNDSEETTSTQEVGGFPGGFSDTPPPEVEQKEKDNAFGEPPASDAEPPETDIGAGFGLPSKPASSNPFGEDSSPAPSPAAKESAGGFSENPFENNESFSTLFSSKAEEDSDIPFPDSGNEESGWGAMFDAGSPDSQTPEPAGLGEMMKQNDASAKKEEAPPEPAPTKAAALGISAEIKKTPVPAAPEPEPEATAKEEEPPREMKSLREPTPVPPTEVAEKSTLKVEEEQLAPTRAPSGIPGEMEVDMRDLEFRAIFSSDESFTLAKVARRVVSLDGVSACALATPAKLVQASQDEQSRLGDEAREMVDAIRNLAKLTGLPEARAFTLQTDRGTVSLFLEGDCCVTVNHQASAFGPGVREKLILIARNIHKLQE